MLCFTSTMVPVVASNASSLSVGHRAEKAQQEHEEEREERERQLY